MWIATLQKDEMPEEVEEARCTRIVRSFRAFLGPITLRSIALTPFQKHRSVIRRVEYGPRAGVPKLPGMDQVTPEFSALRCRGFALRSDVLDHDFLDGYV